MNNFMEDANNSVVDVDNETSDEDTKGKTRRSGDIMNNNMEDANNSVVDVDNETSDKDTKGKTRREVPLFAIAIVVPIARIYRHKATRRNLYHHKRAGSSPSTGHEGV